MLFIADNQKEFLTNAYVRGLDIRNKSHVYLPIVSLSCVQKGVSHSGVKIFNSLPRNIEIYSNDRKIFKTSYTDTLLFIPFVQLLNF